MRKHLEDIHVEDEESEINLTPMLDVVFIMLIFFIVTASFIKEVGIDVNRPDNQQQQQVKPEEANILIVIDGNDDIFINRRLIDPRAVRANIERLHAENPEGSVIIQPNRKSTNKMLVTVMDASRQAGVYNISIAESTG